MGDFGKMVILHKNDDDLTKILVIFTIDKVGDVTTVNAPLKSTTAITW